LFPEVNGALPTRESQLTFNAVLKLSSQQLSQMPEYYDFSRVQAKIQTAIFLKNKFAKNVNIGKFIYYNRKIYLFVFSTSKTFKIHIGKKLNL